jgi:DNA (cytosine-5)-methyltransferase 1
MSRYHTVTSLFAGCGGLDLGFVQAGYRIVFANEIDPWAAETYRRNIGDILVGDINALDIGSLPKAEVVIGGFPCQSFSLAGNRLGFEDTRGTLFYNMAQVIDARRPKAFVMENVKGLLNHDGGQTYKVIESILTNLEYRLYVDVLNCADYGVPQKRERVFIVGVAKSIGKRFAFPDPTVARHRTVREAIEDIMRHTKRVVERFKVIGQGQSLKDVPAEHMQRKRGEPDKISGKVFGQNNYRLKADEPSPTICASFQSNFIHYEEHRNLTAREAARLQGFPDDFVFMGKRTTMSWEKHLSQYQQIGNAVPPSMARAIAEALKGVL